MTRVKRGSVAQRRHSGILNMMKGSRGAHSRLTRTAQQQVMKKLVYAHRHRGLRKRNFRSLWITRINAAAKIRHISYSKIIYQLRIAHISLNRKMLAQIAVLDSQSFDTVVSITSK
jgi:large subunit ribosomal protein L20